MTLRWRSSSTSSSITIRSRVIDTVGKKGVLLLGRFTEGRIAVLERLRDELRKRGCLPHAEATAQRKDKEKQKYHAQKRLNRTGDLRQLDRPATISSVMISRRNGKNEKMFAKLRAAALNIVMRVPLTTGCPAKTKKPTENNTASQMTGLSTL
jgi:hypothetical protein